MRSPVTMNLKPSERMMVESGNPTVVQGSEKNIDETIAALNKKKDDIAKRDKAYAELNAKFDKDYADASKKNFEELKENMREIAKQCPGTETTIVCPVCSVPSESTVVTQHFRVQFGKDTLRDFVASVGSPIFFMKRQKDGVLLCPRCKYTAWSF